MQDLDVQTKYFNYLNQFKNVKKIKSKNNDDTTPIKKDFIVDHLSHVLIKYEKLSYSFEDAKDYDKLKSELSKELSLYFEELIKLNCIFYSYDAVLKRSQFLFDNYLIDENDLNLTYKDELSQLLFVTNELFDESIFSYLNEVIELFIYCNRKYNLL